MSTDAERVIDIYERHADAWVDARLREGSLYERGWLDRFCALVPPGGSVLDVGCGAGEPIARYFSGRGYAVTGVDSSPAMIARFRARLSGQQTLVSDMRTLSLGRLFHGILAWDSFFHLNHGDQRRMFPIFRAHAAPRAALMFTSGPAYGEAIGSLEGEPLYHASFDAAEYRKLLEHEGFAVIATMAEDQTCGGRTVWLAQLRLPSKQFFRSDDVDSQRGEVKSNDKLYLRQGGAITSTGRSCRSNTGDPPHRPSPGGFGASIFSR